MTPSPPSRSDAELVRASRRGDAAAFDLLVRRHYRAAHAVALARLGDPMDAEDAAQDGFIRALEKLDDCRDPARFAAWLLQIVRNRAHNLREARQVRTATTLDHETAPSRDDPGRDAERGELRAALEAGLASLTDVQREVVLLHDLEGWDHRTIAEAVGCSEVMSRQHLFVARRALRARLSAPAAQEQDHD